MNSYKNNKFSFLFQSIIAILPTLDNLSTQSCAQAVDYILFLPPPATDTPCSCSTDCSPRMRTATSFYNRTTRCTQFKVVKNWQFHTNIRKLLANLKSQMLMEFNLSKLMLLARTNVEFFQDSFLSAMARKI